MWTISVSGSMPLRSSAARRVLVVLVAAIVAIAFADSSIVVLGLPQLYVRFETSITGVAWVVTSYNAAVAVTALGLVFLVHRFRAAVVLAAGLVLFLAATIACALAQSLVFLIVARSVQGVGAALLLAGALPVLADLTGSRGRAASVWTLAGTFGAALGPALGGILTQLFDWRAIFVAQAPVAALGLLAAIRSGSRAMVGEGWRPSLARTVSANTCLGLVFGALVGALFLAVLLVIVVWQYSPIGGALIVSVLPVATLAARPLARRLPRLVAVCAGAALLAAGLVALALLPSASVAFAMCALVLCGAGLGLSVPVLSNSALDLGAGLTRSGTLTIGVRHLGLVLAIASIAPLLASDLPPAGDRAMLKATAVLLDAPIGITDKVPIALDLRRAFDKAKDGEIPDLGEPFDSRGARSDATLASARDDLEAAIEETITRAFRPDFFLAAIFAGVAVLVAAVFRRRIVA
jgi:predicted MFS family arabinose efflux permease